MCWKFTHTHKIIHTIGELTLNLIKNIHYKHIYIYKPLGPRPERKRSCYHAEGLGLPFISSIIISWVCASPSACAVAVPICCTALAYPIAICTQTTPSAATIRRIAFVAPTRYRCPSRQPHRGQFLFMGFAGKVLLHGLLPTDVDVAHLTTQIDIPLEKIQPFRVTRSAKMGLHIGMAARPDVARLAVQLVGNTPVRIGGRKHRRRERGIGD